MNYLDFANQNWIALLVAMVANFALGFVYYAAWMPTGRMWMGYMGMDPKAKPEPGAMMKGTIMMVVGSFLMMLVLGHFINKDVAMGLDLLDDQLNFAFSWGILFWLGFQVPILLGAVAWEKKPLGMAIINGGYQLIAMLISALIFVYM